MGLIPLPVANISTVGKDSGGIWSTGKPLPCSKNIEEDASQAATPTTARVPQHLSLPHSRTSFVTLSKVGSGTKVLKDKSRVPNQENGVMTKQSALSSAAERDRSFHQDASSLPGSRHVSFIHSPGQRDLHPLTMTGETLRSEPSFESQIASDADPGCRLIRSSSTPWLLMSGGDAMAKKPGLPSASTLAYRHGLAEKREHNSP